jgi:dimethylaniline monooxygenase (N-oxide forming)
MQDYLEDYVEHYGLRARFRLNARIKQAAREKDSNKWRIDFETGPSKYFDRLVISTGPHAKPLMPELEGSELFQGEIVHAQAFKRYDT